jgi:6-phosphogluconolactonase
MRTLIAVLTMSVLFSAANLQAQNKKEYNLLIGTYTNESKTNGIHVYRFNTQTGEFGEKSKSTEIINPSYLAVSRDRKNVYAVSEVAEDKGSVYAFSFDPKTGALAFQNSAFSGGDHPCYVSVDDKKKCVIVGNYSSGTLSAIPVKSDGSLASETQTIRHEGGSVNKGRQEKPHVHATVLSRDNRFVLVPDLGGDKVYSYKLDVTQPKPLTPNTPPYTTIKAGSGPRHLTFHPKGKFAFLITELDASITAYDYKDGKLEAKQTITMLSPDFKGEVGAADIHVSPDGKFLYGSNRGEANEIVIYSIDKNGKLTYAGRQSTLGKTPRNFEIDPTGNFLLAANQNTNDVIIFKRDKKTGLLTDTGKKIVVDKPVCVKFVAVE